MNIYIWYQKFLSFNCTYRLHYREVCWNAFYTEQMVVSIVEGWTLTGVSVVEVAGCWRGWGEGSSAVGRCGAGAGLRTAFGAGIGVGGAAGEAGAAVWVTAQLWTSPPSPLATWGSGWFNVALSFWKNSAWEKQHSFSMGNVEGWYKKKKTFIHSLNNHCKNRLVYGSLFKILISTT